MHLTVLFASYFRPLYSCCGVTGASYTRCVHTESWDSARQNWLPVLSIFFFMQFIMTNTTWCL